MLDDFNPQNVAVLTNGGGTLKHFLFLVFVNISFGKTEKKNHISLFCLFLLLFGVLLGTPIKQLCAKIVEYT